MNISIYKEPDVQAIRFRSNEEGLVILQVCVRDKHSFSSYSDSTWRDAKVQDLLEVADFCKSDTSSMYESINHQFDKLRFDIFNRMAPPRMTDEERHQIDALNQHQERDE